MATPEDPQYEKTMRQMLAQNEEVAAQLVQNVQNEVVKAQNERAAAEAAWQKFEQEAPQYLADCHQKAVNHLRRDIAHNLRQRLALQLLLNGYPMNNLAALLDLPEGEIIDIAQSQGFERIMSTNTYLRVGYRQAGRGGEVLCYTSSGLFRWNYELAGGEVLATIDIPSPDQWEAATGILLVHRAPFLHHLAARVARDQSFSDKYKIEDTWIAIY